MPTPEEVARTVRRLERKLARLREEYAWAHGMAYNRQVVDGPFEAQVTRGVNESGLATDAVLDHQALRRTLGECGAWLDGVYNEVATQTRMIELGMSAAEHAHGGLWEPVLEPRVAAADVADAREAAARRKARGDGVP